MPECIACGRAGVSYLCPTCRRKKLYAEPRIRSREIRIFEAQALILRLEGEIEELRRLHTIEYTPHARSRGRLASDVPAIADRIRAGATLQNVADQYGVSRERVRQVLAREGLSAALMRVPKPAPVMISPEERRAVRAQKTVESAVKRLWANIDRGKPNECWPWTGACHNSLGTRGVCNSPGIVAPPNLEPFEKLRRTQPARLVWLLERGPIPDGHFISPLCGNRLCCNPDHLSCITPSEHALRTRRKYGPIAHMARKPKVVPA